jgi:hypothetical protein
MYTPKRVPLDSYVIEAIEVNNYFERIGILLGVYITTTSKFGGAA